MKKEVVEFLQGERNAVRGDFIISRERIATSSYCCVSVPQEDAPEPILSGWAKRVRKKYGSLVTVSEIEQAEEKTPKHTGGKRPYVMLMQDNSDVVKSLSLGANGALMMLIGTGCIDWGTGRIMCKRSKKSMTTQMISELLGTGRTKTKQIMAELTKKEVVRYEKKGKAYFMDRRFAKKGSGQDADKV